MRPVAHAYVVDGQCEQIEWGTDIALPDDPSLVLLYSASPESILTEIEARVRGLEALEQSWKNTRFALATLRNDAMRLRAEVAERKLEERR